jgi:hypothetical protein
MSRSIGGSEIPTIAGTQQILVPAWAILQRRLIDGMSEAALWFVDRYTNPDGTLRWAREVWPGMDGSDDAYESFSNLPLLYLLGGDQRLRSTAQFEWDAITWQFTEYGQVYREFDAYYDWMHHGESLLSLYYLGLAGPNGPKAHRRAVRFAGFYTGEDPTAPNYDPVQRLIRSPLTGSRGPRFETTPEDWAELRGIYSHYLKPFDDLPGFSGAIADWNDPGIFHAIVTRFNARMARGDVPINLFATTLISHAYLMTGDERYHRWVVDYLAAWSARTEHNGGIIPDTVGLTGRIGEYLDGKWWGGYYGWSWPHGGWLLLEAVTVACMNAVLLTGDRTHLGLIRSQLDALWALGRDVDGRQYLPNRHDDAGWSDYRPADPRLPVLIWSMTHAAEDQARVARIGPQAAWGVVNDPGYGDEGNTLAWYRYIHGDLPDYPEHSLHAAYRHMIARLEAIRTDPRDPREWQLPSLLENDVHHWQRHNPVTCEALVHTMLGAPMAIYHGGLLHTPLRYFDEEAQRSGLPRDVAVLVERVDQDGVVLQLINLDPLHSRQVLVQGGMFGEHTFAGVTNLDSETQVEIDSPYLRVELAPAAGIRTRIALHRFSRMPSYIAPGQP